MPFDVTAYDTELDALVAAFPATGTWRLYADLPTETGVELASDGGYAPATAAVSDWAAASGGSVATTAPVSFGTSTGEWSDVATHWAYCDSLGAVWYWDELPQPISVTESGTAVSFTPELFFREDEA